MDTTRRSPLPLLVLVTVVALLVGSIGTAVAGPALTKGKVKKIATKVINKKAKNLTVASAATAGNASNLGGQPPAAYLNNSHRFRVPTEAPSAVKTFVFDGLAAGSYAVSYQILLSNAQTAACSVLPGGGATVNEALGYSTTVANTSLVTGSGVVALDGVAKPKLICEARPSGNIEIQAGADYPSTVVFTKVGPLTTGTATPTLSSRPARTLP
jgi:hypothetical protein